MKTKQTSETLQAIKLVDKLAIGYDKMNVQITGTTLRKLENFSREEKKQKQNNVELPNTKLKI